MLKGIEKPKERYEFVDCSNGQRPNDPNTRKFVRTHVMHNYRRQKRIAVHGKPAPRDIEIGNQDNNVQRIDELQRHPVISPERWSIDPFDSFPIKMKPYMHELLHLCKFTSPHLPVQISLVIRSGIC